VDIEPAKWGKPQIAYFSLKTAVETMKREAGLLGNTLQIRVRLCSSVVKPKNGS